MKATTNSTALMLALLAAGFALPQAQAAVVLANATTSVTVHGGDTVNARPLVDEGGYFSYTDLATGEETTWSIDPVLIDPVGTVTPLSSGADGGFGSPIDGGGSAVSSALVGAVSVEATTTLSGTHATTTFSFTGPLDDHTFVFYAESDIFGFADDVAGFTGSIAGGDLRLVMYDSAAVSGGAPGLTVYVDAEVTGGAVLSLFGAGIWNEFGGGFNEALEVGDLSVLSADGSNFVTGPADVGLALAFALSGTFATITVDYYTTPDLPPGVFVPEPATLALMTLGLLGLARRRVRV